MFALSSLMKRSCVTAPNGLLTIVCMAVSSRLTKDVSRQSFKISNENDVVVVLETVPSPTVGIAAVIVTI